MRIPHVLLFLTLALGNVASAQRSTTETTETTDGGSTLYLSLVNLIATPEPFLERNVTVTGYLGGDVEPRIYLTKDHMIARDAGGSVEVSILYREKDISENGLGSTGCEGKFVRIVGLFYRDSGGFLKIARVRRVFTFDGQGFRKSDKTARQICWANDSD